MLLLDKIITGLLCFFFLSGFLRGFLKSLIGPVSFFFCFISAIIFYDVNRNILMATFIATAGTIALAIVLNILLMIALSAVDKEIRGKVFPVSRLLGSIINVLWQGNMLFATIILFSTLPINTEQLDTMRSQIPQSRWMKFYNEKVINRDNRLKAIVASLSTMRDPEQVQLIANTKEFATFRVEPKVQEFIHAPDVNEALEKKDGVKLLTSTSLRNLVTDDNAMYSFSKLAVMVYERNLREIGGSPDGKPTP